MGLLDDAIREHLDLKRRRGADPTEIERAEREALGPVRRGPEVGGEGESAVELAAAEPESAVPSPAAEDWEPFDAEAEFQEPAPALEDEALLPAYEPDEEFEDESFEASPFDAEAESAPPPHPADLSPEPEPEPSLAPHPADPPPPAAAPHLDQETEEYELEPEEEEGDDDVLESTPEFLQDAPDHDRLWFEQRPPRDFDFDG